MVIKVESERRSGCDGMPAAIACRSASSTSAPLRRAVRIACLIAMARPRAPRRSASGLRLPGGHRDAVRAAPEWVREQATEK
jgi:hypothetical protein